MSTDFSQQTFAHLLPVVAAAALTACATETAQLNSERIQSMFGSYGIDVRHNDAATRRSSLYSVTDDGKICRTYALVRYLDTSSALIQDEHQLISHGGSMGATFKAAGWRVVKKTVHIGTLIDPNDDSLINDLMQLKASTELALHIYQLSVVRDAYAIDYAIIAEAHHPEYLTEDDLLRIYQYDRADSLDSTYVNEIATQIIAEK